MLKKCLMVTLACVAVSMQASDNSKPKIKQVKPRQSRTPGLQTDQQQQFLQLPSPSSSSASPQSKSRLQLAGIPSLVTIQAPTNNLSSAVQRQFGLIEKLQRKTDELEAIQAISGSQIVRLTEAVNLQTSVLARLLKALELMKSPDLKNALLQAHLSADELDLVDSVRRTLNPDFENASDDQKGEHADFKFDALEFSDEPACFSLEELESGDGDDNSDSGDSSEMQSPLHASSANKSSSSSAASASLSNSLETTNTQSSSTETVSDWDWESYLLGDSSSSNSEKPAERASANAATPEQNSTNLMTSTTQVTSQNSSPATDATPKTPVKPAPTETSTPANTPAPTGETGSSVTNNGATNSDTNVETPKPAPSNVTVVSPAMADPTLSSPAAANNSSTAVATEQTQSTNATQDSSKPEATSAQAAPATIAKSATDNNLITDQQPTPAPSVVASSPVAKDETPAPKTPEKPKAGKKGKDKGGKKN